MHLNYSTSPIRVLDSADRRRPITHEEEFFEVRARRLEAELNQSRQENMLLRRRLLDTDNNILLLQENARLKQEVDILNGEIARLVSQLQAKDLMELKLTEKSSEVEQLQIKLTALQIQNGSQINRLEERSLLERSRTKIIVQSAEDTSAFIEKQLRKLKEDLRQKGIELDEANKKYMTENRKVDQISRENSNKIDFLREQKRNELKALEDSSRQRQYQLENKITELESKIRSLELQNSDLINDGLAIKHDRDILSETVKRQQSEVQGLKFIIEQQRHQHMKQYSQLAASRRNSSRQITSQRSIGEEQPTLTPVKETKTLIVDDRQVLDLKYQEEKKLLETKIESLSDEVQRLSKSLKDKQQELTDILTRFAPLVSIHSEEISLEEDRKQRIDKHWKADVAILDAMLKQYRIKVLQ